MAPASGIGKDVRHTIALLLIAGQVIQYRLPQIVIVIVDPMSATTIEDADKGVEGIMGKLLGSHREPLGSNGLKWLSSLTCRSREHLVQLIWHSKYSKHGSSVNSFPYKCRSIVPFLARFGWLVWVACAVQRAGAQPRRHYRAVQVLGRIEV